MIRRFRDYPIGRKVIVLILLASVAALALATIAVLAYEATAAGHRARRDLTAQAALLERNTVAALAFSDPAAANENLATLEMRPDIPAAALYNADGDLFATHVPIARQAFEVPRRAPMLGTVETGRFIRHSRSVLSSGEHIGTLTIWYELPPLWGRLSQYAITAGVVALALGLASVLLFWALRSGVSNPLLALTATVRSVTGRREYHVRVSRHGNDELGDLTDAFNAMLAALEERDAALSRQSRQLQEAMEAAQLASWRYDPAARTISWSGAETRLFGAGLEPADDAIDTFTDLLEAGHGDQLRAALAHTLGGGGPFELDLRTTGAAGRSRWFTIRGTLAEGEDPRVVGLVQDVTERRRLEEQLLQSQKMEAIGRLAGGVAHDFNNLLTAILGYSRFALGRLRSDDPVADDIREVHRAGERAAKLTQQLLAYSRRQMLQPANVDVNEVVTHVSSMLGRLLGEHIDLVLSLRPASGAILADRTSLEQVIVNLAVNARDAMPSGGRLTIQTDCTELGANRPEPLAALPPGAYVRLSVTDTGHGMDAATMAHVFEPFFTTKEVGKGTGLGLAMVFGTVTQSGGGITVDSAPGAGATFSLFFPRVTGATEHTTDPVAPAPGGRERVMIVEDEAAVLAMAERVLSAQGYEVHAADRPATALATADALGHARTPPDLLVTDVVMPGQSGPELAAELQRRWPDLRVLYVSGYTDDAVVGHGLAESRLDFMQKPFAPEELARRVRSALDASAAGGEAT